MAPVRANHKLVICAGAIATLLVSCARPKPNAAVPVPHMAARDPGEPPGEREGEREDSPFEAAEYFREQRVPDAGPLPVEKYLAAQRHVGTMRRYSLREGRFLADAAASPAAGAPATFGNWESLGPGNVGGRTRGLVIHPTNSKIMWLGGATGGVWKTTDGGQSWTPQTDLAPVLTVDSLVMDPNNPNTLYAGTGEQTQNWRGAGIFKTTDGGQTWAQISIHRNARISTS